MHEKSNKLTISNNTKMLLKMQEKFIWKNVIRILLTLIKNPGKVTEITEAGINQQH